MAFPELEHVHDAFRDVRFGIVVRAFDAKVRIGVILFAFLEHDLDFLKTFFVCEVGKQRTRVLASDAF